MGNPFFDTTKRQDKSVIPAGTVLLLQGQPADALILLHSGMAELLDGEVGGGKAAAPGTAPSAEQLIARSIRVGLLKGESICGVSGFFKAEADRFSIRTISECQVSVIPISNEGVLTAIQKKRGLAIQVLRATQQCIESSSFLNTNFRYLRHKLGSIADSVALANDWGLHAVAKAGGGRGADRLGASLAEYSQALRTALAARRLPAPDSWDPNLFLDRVQLSLDLYAEWDAETIESRIDNPQYLFLKRLIQRSDEVLLPLFERDEPLQYYVFQFFSKTLETLLSLNRETVLTIRQLVERLYGKGGWVETVLALPEAKTDTHLRNFLHYLWKFSTRCESDMQKLLNIKLAETYPLITRLASYHEVLTVSAPLEEGEAAPAAPQATPSAGSGAPAPSPAELAAVAKKYQNLAMRLVEFSELGSGFAEQFKAAIGALRQFPDMFIAEKPAHDARKRFSELYWKLYEVCFLKVINSDFKALVPGVMLHFGLVDENLVRPDELLMIDQAYSRALSVESPIPVMTLPYFLEKIFTGAINPSTNEMGEGFVEVLKRQEKMTTKEKVGAVLYNPSPESKVRYEIQQIASSLSGLLSGSRSRALPMLCSGNLNGSVLKLFLEPLAVSEFINGIRARDFTLFFREAVFKNKLGNDLIRREVLPNIVLYPQAGSRGMMWQELDGTRKDSPARIFIPLFFTEKRDESIVELLAYLRWELSRAVAGYNWMDPTEGGLSGAYYDYITYYKKNPNLSQTAKDALKDFIARTRSERDRFAEEYRFWVLYEYEDKVRLNSVARGIFHRFCPFPKEVRDRQAQKPIWAELEVKYQNRVRKDLLSLESRLRKFEKANLPVPAEILAWKAMLEG